MKKSITLFSLVFLFLVVCSSFIKAQDRYSLEMCINHALKNNIAIQKTALLIDQNNFKLQKDKALRYPNASAFASHGYNFGNSLDIVTYEYIRQNTQSNYFALTSDITLFNGLKTYNTIKADQHDIISSQYVLKSVQDEISLAIANTYLQILMSIENIRFSEEQVDLTSKLLDQAVILVEAGKETKSKIYELKAQLANDEVALVEAQKVKAPQE